MAWLSQNFPALLSVVSMVLGLVIAVLHMLHKDSVAQSLQDMEDAIAKLQAPKQ